MTPRDFMKGATLSARLLTAFAIVIVLLVAVAALGQRQLSSLNQQVDLLANNRVPQVIAAGRLEAAVQLAGRHMQTVFVLVDEAEVKAELKALRDNRAALVAQQGLLGRLVQEPKGRALLQQVEQAGRAYLEAEEAFSRHGEGGQLEDAKTVLLIQARPAQATYVQAIARLGSHVQEEAREMARQSAASYQGSLVTFGIATLMCVAAGCVVALMLARGLRRQLGGEPAYAADVVTRVAGGDLTVDVKLATGDRASLLYAMREMVASLRQMLGDTARGARAVADTSAQIAQGNVDLSQRTEEQASTLEEAASSMEDLTTTVAQNARNAQKASQLAASAADTAKKGSEVVDEVVNTMDQILDASKKIADIIGVIDGIAFQTNILALNAAVEAARAGDQGRGFAVVAGEVRNLAHRTTVAAKEIKALIADSAGKVEAGSARVDEAGHTMVGVVLSIEKVNHLIAEIAAASQDQSGRIGQVTTAVQQMDRVVQQNAALVEEAAAATESMKDQAGQLLAVVSRFKLDAGLGGAVPTELHPLGPEPAGAAGAAGDMPAALESKGATTYLPGR